MPFLLLYSGTGFVYRHRDAKGTIKYLTMQTNASISSELHQNSLENNQARNGERRMIFSKCEYTPTVNKGRFLETSKDS